MKSHKNDSHETRIAILEHIAYETNQTFKRIDENFLRLDEDIKNLGKSLNAKLDDVFKTLNAKIDRTLMWLMGTILVLTGSPIILEIIKTVKSYSHH